MMKSPPSPCNSRSELQATSTRSTQESSSLDDLPDELKIQILAHLPFKTIAQMGRFNKTWRTVTRDNFLWKEKISTDFPWLTVSENQKTDFLKIFKTHHKEIPPEIKIIFSIMAHGQECIEKFDELCEYFEKYPDLITKSIYQMPHYKDALAGLIERKNPALNKEFFLKIKKYLATKNPTLLNWNLMRWTIALHAYENWDEEIKPYLEHDIFELINAFYTAIHYNNHDAVEKILDFKKLDCQTELFASTPLSIAAKFSDLAMIDLLFKRGAWATPTVIIPTYNGYPLHAAAVRGNIAMMQKLLEAGAEVDVSNEKGWTPLLSLIKDATLPEEGLPLLIGAGANVNARVQTWTAVMLAVEACNPQALQLLLDKGAWLDCRNKENKTALDLALDFYRHDMLQHNYYNQAQWFEIIRLLLSHPFASFPALRAALKQGSLNQENLHDINQYLNQTPDFKIHQEFIDDINNYLKRNAGPELKKIFHFFLFLSSYINNYTNKKDHKSWFSLLSLLIKFVDGLEKEIATLTKTYTPRNMLSPQNYNVALHFFRKFDNLPWVETLLDADTKLNILPENALDLALTHDDRLLTCTLISHLFKTHIMQTTPLSCEAHHFSLCDAAKKEDFNKADLDNIHRFLNANPKFKISDKFMQNLKNYLEKKNLSSETKEILHFSLILCYYVNRYQNRREHHQVLFLRLDGLPQFFSRSEKLKAMGVWLTTPLLSEKNTLQTQYPALTYGKLRKTLSL